MKTKLIEDYLDELFINPKCELNYNTDYELLINIMLSSQTTDKKVNAVTEILYNKYNSLDKLSKADYKDIEDIIKPLGMQKTKSKNIVNISKMLIDDYNGKVPDKKEELIKLPGIGNKSAQVFLGEYYKIPAFGVDTHVFRTSKRLGLANEKDNVLDVETKLKKLFKKDVWYKRHLQFVLFGRYYCTSINPKCKTCKLGKICKYYNK